MNETKFKWQEKFCWKEESCFFFKGWGGKQVGKQDIDLNGLKESIETFNNIIPAAAETAKYIYIYIMLQLFLKMRLPP